MFLDDLGQEAQSMAGKNSHRPAPIWPAPMWPARVLLVRRLPIWRGSEMLPRLDA